jgi:hypothetical protein
MQKRFQHFGDDWVVIIPPKYFIVTFTTIRPVKGKA